MQFNTEAILHRALMYRGIREYFNSRGYLETETPILTESPIPESHIELFRTERTIPGHNPRRLFLVPSPEVFMKQLLASGSPSLYQIGRCFRNGEQLDRWHRNEFTMLEWYALNKTADENIPVMQEVLELTVRDVNPEAGEETAGRIRNISMEEAFRDFAGFSLESDLTESGISETGKDSPDYPGTLNHISEILRYRLQENSLPPGEPENETPDDLFHRLFLTLVEDELPRDRPLVLTRWPAFIPTLARDIPGTPWADRWELYIRGVEVANCYGEETEEVPLKEYWKYESSRLKKEDIPEIRDSQWPASIARGMPPCSGTAVGLDRLLALVRGDDSLKGLDLFPIHDNMPR
jgi:lysyl-tRNA synthetase class 2